MARVSKQMLVDCPHLRPWLEDRGVLIHLVDGEFPLGPIGVLVVPGGGPAAFVPGPVLARWIEARYVTQYMPDPFHPLMLEGATPNNTLHRGGRLNFITCSVCGGKGFPTSPQSGACPRCEFSWPMNQEQVETLRRFNNGNRGIIYPEADVRMHGDRLLCSREDDWQVYMYSASGDDRYRGDTADVSVLVCEQLVELGYLQRSHGTGTIVRDPLFGWLPASADFIYTKVRPPRAGRQTNDPRLPPTEGDPAGQAH